MEKRKSPHPELKKQFTDKELLEELIIRVKKGCIEIKNTKKGLVLEEECRWDLGREGENYSVSLSELREVQNYLQKLERENKLCNGCLEREIALNDRIFCKLCWEREIKQQGERSRAVKSLKKS